MDSFLRFTLISYAAILFFALGLRLALLHRFGLNLFKLLIIFTLVATALSFSLTRKPLQDRLLISVIWTSVIVTGFRFGRKIRQS